MITGKIQCFEGQYDKELFYSKMGRFFAEEQYLRRMPYLRNESDRIWFVIERDGKVIAFSSLRIMDEYVLFTTEYVEEGHRRQGLFKALTDIRFKYCSGLDMPIRTATNVDFIRDYYIRRGFDVYRATKHYWFLCSEGQEVASGIGKYEKVQNM
ncbi:hypothetical protein DS742_25415 [Lacrimispora amygdalina]|uniref:N-acetyltransferase domain-containing protein n=1 Tax=Lacrimispora amygdalina TaxID=253257 RepID=A0A3E2N553_9FIRM|nr:GNAT family N-acetyltransferase [Clostridium indicum]RFZ76115.1 hypothetical protein DS742_25415 [Clostridium indicum]